MSFEAVQWWRQWGYDVWVVVDLLHVDKELRLYETLVSTIRKVLVPCYFR